MKNRKYEILLSTAVCLLPLLAGALLYNRLPETMATHFGIHGEENGWSSRGFAVFGIPLIMAVLNLVLHLSLNADPKRHNMNATLRAVSLWITPVLSVLVSSLTIGHALGYAVHVEVIVPLLIGLLFIIIGNYMPKTRQSYTMGIRVPWTLASEENWNRTHRLGGFLFVFAGIGMIFTTLLGLWSEWLLPVLLVFPALVPILYSYALYRKGI